MAGLRPRLGCKVVIHSWGEFHETTPDFPGDNRHTLNPTFYGKAGSNYANFCELKAVDLYWTLSDRRSGGMAATMSTEISQIEARIGNHEESTSKALFRDNYLIFEAVPVGKELWRHKTVVLILKLLYFHNYYISPLRFHLFLIYYVSIHIISFGLVDK
jgi:hypothetical protein